MVYSNLRRNLNKKNEPNKSDQNLIYWVQYNYRLYSFDDIIDIIFFYFTTLTLKTPSIAVNCLMISSDTLFSMSNMVYA